MHKFRVCMRPKRLIRPQSLGGLSLSHPAGLASPCNAYFKPGPTPGPELARSCFLSSLAASPKKETISHNYKHCTA